MAKMNIALPAMGEGVIEATINKWLVEVGATVKEDDPLVEIATDKVDTEVPSPSAGKIVEIKAEVGSVIKVGGTLAVLEIDVKAGPEEEKKVEKEVARIQETVEEIKQEKKTEDKFSKEMKSRTPGGKFLSPLVRSIVAQEGIPYSELDTITGTGMDGRITRDDVLHYIEARKKGPAKTNEQAVENEENIAKEPVAETEENITKEPAAETEENITNEQEAGTEKNITKEPAVVTEENITNEQEAGTEKITEEKAEIKQEEPAPESRPKPEVKAEEIKKVKPVTSGGDEIIEMDRVRKLIADHMVMSKRTSAHVTSFIDADVTRLVTWRNSIKEKFLAAEGQKLTLTPIFIDAAARALYEFPMINVSVEGTTIIRKKNINIGMATALPNGNLIVPVIRNVNEKSLTGIARAVNDLAERARNNKLKPDEITGGTFSLTNFGSYDNLAGTPIINQPQVAILGTGAVRKVPAVIETPDGDVIAIRHIMILSLSYDHRVIDGALAGRFLHKIKNILENYSPEIS